MAHPTPAPAALADTAPALPPTDALPLPVALERLAQDGLRYGLVLVIGWIGLMKFTAYEAEAISGFVASSPLMSWLYSILSVREASALIGVVEVAVAALLAVRPIGPRTAAASAAGAVAAIGMLATTLTFLVTTPGAFEPSAGGFPALSAIPGQFLIKDAVLLAAAASVLAEALRVRSAACLAKKGR